MGLFSKDKVSVKNGIAEAVFGDKGELTKARVDKLLSNKKLGERYGVVITEAVTSIAPSAFWGKKGLCGLVTVGGVSIGDRAFEGCSSLGLVSLADGVTLGKRAFADCTDLKEIEIKLLKDVEPGAFEGCKSLKKAVVSGSFTRVDDRAFKNCSALEEITLPKGLRSIGEESFFGCGALVGFEIPQGVKKIEKSAFEGCASLASISVPEGVTAIEEKAFCCCEALSEALLPEGLVKIGERAFEKCNSLKQVTLPKGLEVLESKAFSCCHGLQVAEVPKSITKIGDWVFECSPEIVIYCESTEKATEWGMFWKEFDYPVKKGFFEGASRNKAMNDSEEDVIVVGNMCTILFTSKDQLNKEYFDEILARDDVREAEFITIKIEGDITHVDGECFKRCEKIKQIMLSKRVNFISSLHFIGCNVERFYVEEGSPYYLEIDGNLYSKAPLTLAIYARAKKDKEYVVPEGVEFIGGGSIESCNNLERIVLPRGVERVSDFAIEWNKNLKEIIVSETVTEIKSRAIYNCASLESIEVDENNPWYKSISGNLYSKDGERLLRYAKPNETETQVADGTRVICTGAFDNSAVIKKIRIPSTVVEIEKDVIGLNTSIESIYIPSSVEKIAEGAICIGGYSKIYCQAAEKPSGWADKWNKYNRPVEWGKQG